MTQNKTVAIALAIVMALTIAAIIYALFFQTDKGVECDETVSAEECGRSLAELATEAIR